jgi:hypothetical protein
VRVLPGRCGLRHHAFRKQILQVQLVHAVTRQIHVELERRHREVAPDHNVGQDRGRRGIIDRHQRSRGPGFFEIDLEVRQQQGSCGLIGNALDAGDGASAERDRKGYK